MINLKCLVITAVITFASGWTGVIAVMADGVATEEPLPGTNIAIQADMPPEPVSESPVEPMPESPSEPVSESPVEPMPESPAEPDVASSGADAQTTESAEKTMEPAQSTETEHVESAPLRGDAGAPPPGAVQIAVKPDVWRVGVGGLFRAIKTRSWRSGSYSQNYPIDAKSADKIRRYESGGAMDATADRYYDDGYVGRDDWTGLDGDTWNWGYDNSSQVRDNVLSLRWTERQVTDHRRVTEFSEGVTEDSGDDEPGVYIKAQRAIYQASCWDCRLHFDFMRVLSSVDGQVSNFRDEQTWRKWEEYKMDYYSLDGTGITPSSAPYQGNYNDVGPSIANVPARRQGAGSRLLEERSYLACNDIKHDLDLRLMTFSLGLSVNYNYKRLSLGGATGPTINLAETDATYQETLYESWDGGTASVLNEWRDSRSESDATFGYFVQAEAALRLAVWLELGMFGRYDWLENITRDIGQSRYVMNPEGGSLGGSLNLVF